MAELRLGDPAFLGTDLGPVIDAAALAQLQAHAAAMKALYPVIYELAVDPALDGYFFPPLALEIPEIGVLSQEVFGPILHVIPYHSADLESILTQINASGYGLTLGIQSRINETIDYIQQTLHVGNCYVNRNMIGAVVGLQPFGGEGLSGTGPKAGGPYYLPRLCHERTLTVDTTAAGGNASLMAQVDA
jgi:RHH-type proline utilization regulon transcriptional repressor/proline dehydrogenase/delta 1-pyrroline-5-carboxylate dehydrogenase